MPLEFRARNYRREEALAAAALAPRSPAPDHPLAPPSLPSCSSSSLGLSTAEEEKAGPYREANSNDDQEVDFSDPLGLHISNKIHNDGAQHMWNFSPERQSDEDVQHSNKEWEIFKKALKQKFTCSSTVHVHVASEIISKTSKEHERSAKAMHLEELEDPEKVVEDKNKIITSQEYITRLKELKIEIERAWKNEDRITSLKLAIKVARLLMDTSVFQFYPMLFILVTDVLDMLGALVWERIKKKAEYDDNGTLICILTDGFVSADVCSDAKETCYNWFCKIGSIRELLPRIYLELGILRCWRFLRDEPSYYLRRLTLMMKGIADPIASAYCHLYMVHCAEPLAPDDKGYIVMSITDINSLLRRIISEKETIGKNLGEDTRMLITLLEPPIQWIMKAIVRDERSINDILVEFGMKDKLSRPHGGITCLSVVLHYLLKEFPVKVLSLNALEILELIEHNKDISFDQHLNYRLIGYKLSDGQLPVHYAHLVVDRILQVISQYNGLNEYLLVADAYLDIILQYNMDNSLSAILDSVLKRSRNGSLTDDEMDILKSILVKTVHQFGVLEDACTLDLLVPIIDLLHGEPHSILSMHILGKITSVASIRNARTIQFLFEISRALHNDLDISNFKDDHQWTAGLIYQFVRRVDFGYESDRHLEFLVECRSAFRNIDDLKDFFIHSSNRLAMKAIKTINKYQLFVKACIAFNEVTIPSISDKLRQLNLYLETAEIALSGCLFSHVEGLLDLSITCLEDFSLSGDTHSPPDADLMFSSVLKLCSFLIIVPGRRSSAHIVRTILAVIQHGSWVTPVVRVKMLCAIISLMATLSQKELPYQIINAEVAVNSVLLYGEESYYQELESTANLALQCLVDIMEKVPNSAVQGKMALDACNCLAASFNAGPEISFICSRINKVAKTGLLPQNKYLLSTDDFLRRYMPDSLLEPSTAVSH